MAAARNYRRQRMARHNISGSKHRKSFAKKQRRTRAINMPQSVMRGGIRL